MRKQRQTPLQVRIETSGNRYRFRHVCKVKPSTLFAAAGFTLIELMVVVMIIAMLAAIAVPSYRKQVRQNAEHQAKQRVLTIANELSSWRTKRLTYKGFIPRNVCNGSDGYCYSETGKGVIYVPLGSTAATHRYAITIVDAQATEEEVNNSDGTTETVSRAVPLDANSGVSGKGWRLIAEPNDNYSILETASVYYMDSLGFKCQYSTGAQIPILTDSTITCTEAGASTW